MTDQPMIPPAGFSPNTIQSQMFLNSGASNVNVSLPGQPLTTWWTMPGQAMIPSLPGFPPNTNQSHMFLNSGAPNVIVSPPGPPLTMWPTPARPDNMQPLTRQPPANPAVMRPESAYIRQPGHSQVPDGSDSLRQQDPFRYNEYGMTPLPWQVGHVPQQAYENRLYQGEHRSGTDEDEVMQTRFRHELQMVRMGFAQTLSYDVVEWMLQVVIFHCDQSSNGN